MSDIKLSLSSRNNLLSLQNTSDLITRTSNRLATGQKVSSAVDDAPAFFASQSLTYRATDFSNAQSNIDQAVSAVNAALDGLKSIEKLVQIAQGTLTTLLNAATLTASEELRANYNNTLTQIDSLANSTSYQGKNLINTSTETLAINFDENFATTELSITARRSDSAGLSLTTISANAFFTNANTIPSRASIQSLASVASIQSVASRASVASAVSVASQNSVASVASGVSVNSQASSAILGTPSQASIASYTSIVSMASMESRAAIDTANSVNSVASIASVASSSSVNSVASSAQAGTVSSVNTTLITTTQARVQNALSALRSSQAALGTNVAVLQIRLDFTKNYVNTLETGSDKLTLADMNEEGANLTSLQTRQQLGTISLSISTQSEQSILRLF